jgi:lipopolysaccharide biosynthesis protein
MNTPAQVISIVLPQFHPIPENDLWWGKGFTEWTNVAKAKPRFPGHYQPHLPGELGFYDLRLPEARLAQAQLAAEHGITGFCYYHYWFNGRGILDKPVNEIIRTGEPDFPFCLCWANENWTKAWDGMDREVLLEQHYSQADDEAHIAALMPALADPRCIRIGGRPLFIVYKANQLPDPKRTFDTWRSAALRAGVGELCLAQFEADGGGTARPPSEIGLDYSIEFTPDWRNLAGQIYRTPLSKLALVVGLLPQGYRHNRVCDYESVAKRMAAKSGPAYPYLRCVSPGFDNSSRRAKKATILVNNTPEAFEDWLNAALEWTRSHNKPEEQVVFINAWNEWAEGNHLEPDAKNGRSFLQAAQRAIARS